MRKPKTPKGNENREAIAALGGYVYQVYQSALAWLELDTDEFLFLEVAEDYVVAAQEALEAVQVKGTSHKVTINSDDIVASIDSFVELRTENPQIEIRLRHLTTSQIGRERSTSDRIGKIPTLEMWRNLARTGDVAPLRKILKASKLSTKTKKFIDTLEDGEFREQFLKRIYFDCGAPDFKFLKQQLQAKLIKLLQERGGVASQADNCLNNILAYLLQKSIQKKDRCVDRVGLESLLETATHTPMNRVQLDAQNELIAKALAASIPKTTDLVSTRLAYPRPVSEVPLPSAIAQRTIHIGSIVSSLEEYGVGWILGAAGVGKTVAAKLAALRTGGNWASLNLRGLSSEQVSDLLTVTTEVIMEEHEIHGLLLDDLECIFEPHVIEKFLNLLSVCNRRDLLLLVTAPRPASSDMFFTAGLPPTIETKLEEFTEEDIQQILKSLGVEDQYWAKYIHLVSGGGHPQLAIATIQSMQRAGWDTGEFKTLNSLLVGTSEVDQVRARTRERLLQELPEGSRRLLERLSLMSGSFKRSLVLDMAQVEPAVSDGGMLFDQLIGSWVDQQAKNQYALSPLLSNFAASTLTNSQKEEMHFEIANSLMKLQPINPIEANSALFAAWIGKNEAVLFRLCFSLIGSMNSDLQTIAPHFLTLMHMRTDIFAYEDNPTVSQLFRGAQLLVLCYEDQNLDHFREVLECFERETARIPHADSRAGMALIIYAKLMLSEPVFGPLPQFWDILQKLDVLIENQDGSLPDEILDAIPHGQDFPSTIGFMFLNQARQFRRIKDLVSAFEFLESCDVKFRAKIFKPYDNLELSLDVDMLISGAWLKEHDANTMDSIVHSSAFEHMENLASCWGRQDLAVACRKYRAVILDEYGNDKEAALSVLDEGLKVYDLTNSELIRAKAKVLYRANDHQASLELSSKLIDNDLPLSETEKAFLGREAAISAENQGDFETARRYYLYGAVAAKECGVPNMVPMHIGLLADAALAYWHAGERDMCLQELVIVLQKLETLDSKSSLRAAHCHAVCRHLLLWLGQDATGEPRLLDNGEVTEIYPGLVSNPEPNSEIGSRYIGPMEMAWYMLAEVECLCLLNIGITTNLSTCLKNGPVLEGQIILTIAKQKKAILTQDVELFTHALKDSVAEFAFSQKQGGMKKIFDAKNVTYSSFPDPSTEQIESLVNLTEHQILVFASSCLLNQNSEAFDNLLHSFEKTVGFAVRPELKRCFLGLATAIDYNTRFAELLAIYRSSLNSPNVLSPSQIFELAFKVIEVSKLGGQQSLISPCILLWLEEKWRFIEHQQRFLLRKYALQKNTISGIWAQEMPNAYAKVLAVLITILPTIGLYNEGEIKSLLESMSETAT